MTTKICLFSPALPLDPILNSNNLEKAVQALIAIRQQYIERYTQLNSHNPKHSVTVCEHCLSSLSNSSTNSQNVHPTQQNNCFFQLLQQYTETRGNIYLIRLVHESPENSWAEYNQLLNKTTEDYSPNTILQIILQKMHAETPHQYQAALPTSTLSQLSFTQKEQTQCILTTYLGAFLASTLKSIEQEEQKSASIELVLKSPKTQNIVTLCNNVTLALQQHTLELYSRLPYLNTLDPTKIYQKTPNNHNYDKNKYSSLPTSSPSILSPALPTSSAQQQLNISGFNSFNNYPPSFNSLPSASPQHLPTIPPQQQLNISGFNSFNSYPSPFSRLPSASLQSIPTQQAQHIATEPTTFPQQLRSSYQTQSITLPQYLSLAPQPNAPTNLERTSSKPTTSSTYSPNIRPQTNDHITVISKQTITLSQSCHRSITAFNILSTFAFFQKEIKFLKEDLNKKLIINESETFCSISINTTNHSNPNWLQFFSQSMYGGIQAKLVSINKGICTQLNKLLQKHTPTLNYLAFIKQFIQIIQPSATETQNAISDEDIIRLLDSYDAILLHEQLSIMIGIQAFLIVFNSSKFVANQHTQANTILQLPTALLTEIHEGLTSKVDASTLINTNAKLRFDNQTLILSDEIPFAAKVQTYLHFNYKLLSFTDKLAEHVNKIKLTRKREALPPKKSLQFKIKQHKSTST